MNELFRKIALAVQQHFNDFDRSCARTDDRLVDDDYCPLFIVGPPRTGTTLLYQYLLQNLELAYISNIMALMPCHMLKLCRIAPGIARHYTGALHPGYHGFVPGLRAPSEAGKIVDQWFDGDNWLDNRTKIRQSFAAISHTTGLPLLLKSLTNSTRIDRLHHTFPGARFIVTSRDERFAAQSILLARQRLQLAPDAWWSVQPPGSEALAGASDAFRAVWQVVATNQTIARTLAATGADVIHVRYEQFCDDPAGMMRHLADKFGLTISPKAQGATTSFKPATDIRVDTATWREIEQAVRKLTSATQTT